MCSHQEDVLKEHFHCSLLGAGTSFSLPFVFVTVWSESENKGAPLQCKAALLLSLYLSLLLNHKKRGDQANASWFCSFISKLCIQSISIILGAA